MYFYLIQIKAPSYEVLVLSYFLEDEVLVILFKGYLITELRLYTPPDGCVHMHGRWPLQLQRGSGSKMRFERVRSRARLGFILIRVKGGSFLFDILNLWYSNKHYLVTCDSAEMATGAD